MPKLQRTIRMTLQDYEEVVIRTIQTFVNACNEVSVFAHATEIFDVRALHDELYRYLREAWGLKAQMACNAVRHVVGLYTDKNAQNQSHKRKKGVYLERLTMPLQKGRDWSLLQDGRISLSTLEKRVKVTCVMGHFQRRYLDEGWTPTGARLVYREGHLELHMTVEKEAPEPLAGEGVLGIDLGQSNLAVISDGKKVNVVIKGGVVKDRQRRYRELYHSLQTKGTRGARHKLREQQGKQQRWQSHVNQGIANRVIEWTVQVKATRIGAEDLTGVRSRGKRKTRRQTADFHNWAFYQLRQYLTYKAASLGIQVILVSAHYTSQQCSRCGHLEENQRKKHTFCCKGCGCKLHADVNAARNIALRASLQGQCSGRPGSSQ